ncbi:peptide ABC transporter substrate-binding protein, partial [Bullifex sp.]|uniref:peptide ABC transporter substrate-binding protein n=1 Tax=Bullifex sp. TaxID=2815808 RepID=UPI002A7FE96F
MKKFMTIALCVLLVSLTLVSCGGKKEETKAATPAATTTTTTAPATTAKAEAPKAEAPKAEAPKAETPAPVATPAADKVVFKISNGAEPESLDPAKIQGVPEHRLYEALFEGLIIFDPKTADGIPGLAESWTVSEDGMTYTFKLRKANWSDGTPITAKDVVYSWLRELAPETASPYAWFPAMFLEGAAEYNAGEADASAVGIKAIDDYTFEMKLIGPLPYVIGALGHYSFAVVPQHAIEKYGDAWVLPENFVGNGPYVLKEWTPQSRIVCEKNEAYWDKDNVKLDEVIFYASDDDNTNYNMYLAGEIDWLTGIAQDRLESAQMRTDYQVAPQLSTYYYTIQTTKAPFDDARVRRALSYAIDRQTLVDQVTKGGQLACWGIVPEMAGYEGLGETRFDP